LCESRLLTAGGGWPVSGADPCAEGRGAGDSTGPEVLGSRAAPTAEFAVDKAQPCNAAPPFGVLLAWDAWKAPPPEGRGRKEENRLGGWPASVAGREVGAFRHCHQMSGPAAGMCASGTIHGPMAGPGPGGNAATSGTD